MIASNIKVGQILTFNKTDGSTVPVKVLGEPFFGAFGWSVRCTVTEGPWAGQSLDIQTINLNAVAASR